LACKFRRQLLVLVKAHASVVFSFMSELNIALPLLDSAVHSFGTPRDSSAIALQALTTPRATDFVRGKSPFLLSAALCAASRFLRGGPDTTPELVTSIPPERARAVHESCLRLAHQQMYLAFQHAITTLEVVQAMTLLSIWKEPDDDKAGFYFNRVSTISRPTDIISCLCIRRSSWQKRYIWGE
jgi:hypothetical protein